MSHVPSESGEHEKADGLHRERGDRPAVALTPRHSGANPGRDGAEQHEREHVVHDGRAEDDFRFAVARGIHVAEHAGGDPDARRGDGGAEKQVSGGGAAGMKQRGRQRAHASAGDGPDHRDDKRGWSDGGEIAHRQTESDLEEQQQHPDLRQDVEIRVRAERAETLQPGEVPEQHAGQQLSQHGRLTEPQRRYGRRRGGGHQHDGEPERKLAEFVERAAARHASPAREQASA